MHLEETVVELINLIVPIVEAFGAAIIVIGVVRAVWQLLLNRLTIDVRSGPSLRVGLAEYLIVALEFQVAADVLKTAIAPTWTHLGTLAAVVVLRTALSLVLEREIKELRHGGPGSQEPARNH